MTLDEAIKHCKDKAKDLREQPFKEKMDIEDVADCEECAEEHEQLAEWLEDYKRLLGEKSYAMGYQDGLEDGLNDIRPKGKWKYHRAKGYFLPYMECDNCHEEFSLNMLRPADFRKVNRFCLNCGADMRGNNNETN